MALNQWMHPRNIYRDHKPNFKELAEKFPEFKKHTTTDEQGKILLDFKDADSLRALTCALLLNDFGLQVELPPDRLVPTVPLRLNYILWLEDLLQAGRHGDTVHGIDIGTGSSCVYPLLGASKNQWNFLATESDATNYEYAQKNVRDNNLQDKVTVVKVTEGGTLCELFQDAPTERPPYDFCMCNPPFFGSNFEAWGVLTTRSDARAQPMSVNTASPQESIVPGGEVQFVEAMISDSLVIKDKIRLYTTMLGKKASLGVLKAKLRSVPVANIGTTEFCQGRTMRWGLAWSFDSAYNFPKSPRKTTPAANKKVCPLVYQMPPELSMETAEQQVLGLFSQLKMVVKKVYSTASRCCWNVVAQENTWSHDRRRRREEQRKKAVENKEEGTKEEGTKEEGTNVGGTGEEGNNELGDKEEARGRSSCTCGGDGDQSGKRKADNEVAASKCICLDNGQLNGSTAYGKSAIPSTESEIQSNKPEMTITESEIQSSKPEMTITESEIQSSKPEMTIAESEIQSSKPEMTSLKSLAPNGEVSSSCNQSSEENRHGVSEPSATEPMLSARVTLKKEQDKILLEMLWKDGKNKELLHQVLQYFKNHLK